MSSPSDYWASPRSSDTPATSSVPPVPPVPPMPPVPQRRSRTSQLLLGACALVLVGLVLTPRSAFSVRIGGGAAADVEAEMAALGQGLDAWWTRQLGSRDRDFLPVGERLTDGGGSVRCNGEPVVIDEALHRNAWASTCREGPTVAFDPEPFLDSPVAMEFVLAHEWGHIVQFLHRDLDVTVADPDADPAEAELQADCLAGAWASGHMSPGDHALVIDDVRASGDPRSVRNDDPDGHGTSDERTAAFQTGVIGGVDACLPPRFDPR